MFPTLLQQLAGCTDAEGDYFDGNSFNYCTVLYFSEIK
jgi:hypothetical protein